LLVTIFQMVSVSHLVCGVNIQKVQRLKSSLHFVGVNANSRHTIFATDESGVRSYMKTRTGREVEGTSRPAAVTSAPERVRSPVAQRSCGAYRELVQRSERQQKLEKLAAQLAYDKEVMGKGRKRKMACVNTESAGARFRWKSERKK
jgi:Utp11 protein